MAKTVTISDDLASRLEERRRQTGQRSVDDVAETLISLGLAFDSDDDLDPNGGYTDDELRALIAEAEASGPAEIWSLAEVSAEIRQRHAARSAKSG
jgi:hypothetical protein